MKTKFIFILLGALLSGIFGGCDDDVDPVIDELNLSRALSPTGLEATIRNRTTIELNWNSREDADHYIVEFSEGNLEFNEIIRTLTVTPDELPVQETFFGDTQYSARVKAVNAEGLADSKWSAITIRTATENILKPIVVNTDIGITTAIIKWPAGQQATHFVINPGSVQRTITAEEIENGEAIIEELDYYTDYSVIMYAGNSQRGNTTFKTLMDPDCATCVKLSPGNDISNAIDAAADGSIIILEAGTYPDEGAISISKSVTIQAAVYYDQPVVYAQLTCAATVTSLAVRDTKFRGDTGTPLAQFFNTLTGCNLTSLIIDGCEISNYNNGLLYNNVAGVFGAINISNSYIHTMAGSGGDGIDIRGGTIGSLTVENCTFANGFRSFLRLQATSVTSFKNCTFYKISGLDNSNNSGIFRTGGTAGMNNTLEVRNCLFVETGIANPVSVQSGNWCRSAGNMVAVPTYANNNIHSCYNLLVGLYTTAAQVSATELNPGFVDAANGDFTVTNQTIIDNNIGDPRWLP